jgi:hypothetical protein
MQRTLYFVFLRDGEEFSSGFLAVYVDDPKEAMAHAHRAGGVVIKLDGSEMLSLEDQNN